jgi:hypothetical protein
VADVIPTAADELRGGNPHRTPTVAQATELVARRRWSELAERSGRSPEDMATVARLVRNVGERLAVRRFAELN